MINQEPAPHSFHPIIFDAYTAVDDWLLSLPNATGFKLMRYRTEVLPSLNKPPETVTIKEAAAHYFCFFSTHFFKVAHVLESVVGDEEMASWLKYTSRLCIVDIGCGSGAATAATIEAIIRLKERGILRNPIHIFALGVDPNQNALIIYNRLVGNEIKNRVEPLGINIDLRLIPRGVPGAISLEINALKTARDSWNLPSLPHVLVLPVNLLDWFIRQHRSRLAQYETMADLGVDVGNVIVDDDRSLGNAEAIEYKHIFDEIPVDHLHIATIATQDQLLEEFEGEYNPFTDIFKNDVVHRMYSGNAEFIFERHPRAMGYRRNEPYYSPRPFYVDFTTISNARQADDAHWQHVIDISNLKLAWARARANLLREAFYDEVELRLFEQNLDNNLTTLHFQLIAYAMDIAHTDDRIAYGFPKNDNEVRPKALSRLEEEIISVAIIQVLGGTGSRLRSSSYAYRISNNRGNHDTEYLYENWFEAHRTFVSDARAKALSFPNGKILRTDIRSFYKRIIQQRLVELASTELRTDSSRVRWLLKQLLIGSLAFHDDDRGLIQGGVGSGYYANLYLTEVDTLFGAGNQWNASLFRYVDDMIIVIPDANDIDDVQTALVACLETLGLELNEDKTEKLSISDFLAEPEQDTQVDEIYQRFRELTNSLWIADSIYRANLREYYENSARWWNMIHQYTQRQKVIDIYFDEQEVSRKVHQYLFNERRRQLDLHNRNELNLLPITPTEGEQELVAWKVAFQNNNQDWISLRDGLTREVETMFLVNSDLIIGDHPKAVLHEAQTRLRFTANRLCEIGWTEITAAKLHDLLTSMPWAVGDPNNIIASLANQNFEQKISSLLSHYVHSQIDTKEYILAVILRAARFLPNLPTEIIDALLHFCIQGSIVERIMASETLLYTKPRLNSSSGSIFVENVNQSLASGETSNERLKKNYLLLLGLYAMNLIPDILSDDGESLISRARSFALNGDTGNLFDYYEPDEIRQNFYSGYYPTEPFNNPNSPSQ